MKLSSVEQLRAETAAASQLRLFGSGGGIRAAEIRFHVLNLHVWTEPPLDVKFDQMEVSDLLQ